MDAMLHALGEILLRAVPTFLLILLLHFYLKGMFFKPMEKVLQARYEATEGARKKAQESLAHAAARAGEYEKALFAAKSEIYQAQEKAFKDMQERQAAAIAAARAAADAQLKEAQAAIAADAVGVRRSLAAESDALAERIAETILRRSAA
jgi:F-type H+-transporting ATPase subunit b